MGLVMEMGDTVVAVAEGVGGTVVAAAAEGAGETMGVVAAGMTEA